ncbi:hypothetical protein BZG36_03115 [Bifiguratus adelaidae]|uniref:Conserved oligomeric Golgi complex subunit 5 n=1 Tax=Bifiguratus adelaidae TaxID=1938954 RepID=A0A261Y0P1_9FUNG|nr:hypothetical protein BZG36_03115 [Bifiguratus adelaidae]
MTRYSDYHVFLTTDFDANAYANAIISQVSSGTGGGGRSNEDVAVALAELTYNVDNLNDQIKAEVQANTQRLLAHVASTRELQGASQKVTHDVEKLQATVNGISDKVKQPYQVLRTCIIQQERLHVASEYLRGLVRFCRLSKRLQTEEPLVDQPQGLANEADLAARALILEEIETLMADYDLEGIEVVDQEMPRLMKTRQTVLQGADVLLQNGLRTQNQSEVASALNIFHNLKRLSDKVVEIMEDTTDALIEEVKRAIDMRSVETEAVALMSESNVLSRGWHQDRTTTSGPYWAQIIWDRLEKLMSSMADHCIRIFLLESVLQLKRDSTSQHAYIEEVLVAVDDGNGLLHHFWKRLSLNFEHELKTAAKRSQFLQTLLVDGYPRLFRLLNEFFEKVALYSGKSLLEYTKTPAYVIMLRSISGFETAYLSRTNARIQDPMS